MTSCISFRWQVTHKTQAVDCTDTKTDTEFKCSSLQSSWIIGVHSFTLLASTVWKTFSRRKAKRAIPFYWKVKTWGHQQEPFFDRWNSYLSTLTWEAVIMPYFTLHKLHKILTMVMLLPYTVTNLMVWSTEQLPCIWQQCLEGTFIQNNLQCIQCISLVKTNQQTCKRIMSALIMKPLFSPSETDICLVCVKTEKVENWNCVTVYSYVSDPDCICVTIVK